MSSAQLCELACPFCRGKPLSLHREPPKGGFVIVARGFSRRAGLARDVGNPWLITLANSSKTLTYYGCLQSYPFPMLMGNSCPWTKIPRKGGDDNGRCQHRQGQARTRAPYRPGPVRGL